MKHLFIIFCISSLLSGCSFSTSKYSTELCVIIDRTDSFIITPNEPDIFNACGLESDIWQGVRIEISEISDIDVHQSKVFEIPKENSLLGNGKVRKAKITNFRNDISNYLKAVKKQNNSTLPHSIIFRSLATQLNALCQKPARHKCLLVYSDLMENADVSFYDSSTFALLKSNPKLIEKEIEKNCILSNQKGIDIYFLYKPASFEDNTRYCVVSFFFKSVFESKDAKTYNKLTINKL